MPLMNTNIILSYLLVVAGVMIWSVGLWSRRQIKKGLLDSAITFGGAFLLAVCFVELVPEAFGGEVDVRIAAGCTLAGVVLQILLEYLTNGVEHGHNHESCEDHDTHGGHSHGQVSLAGLLIGLCIHSFLEGFPLADVAADGAMVNRGLLVGIMLHNIPISLILITLFMSKGLSKGAALSLMLLFAVSTPLGSAMRLTLLGGCGEEVGAYLVAFVVGILLHVSQSLLLDHHEHRFSWSRMVIILVAFTLAMFL